MTSGPTGETAYHRPYLGVVFDLDGTLIQSEMDFHAMRKLVVDLAYKSGVPPGEVHTTMSVPHLVSYTTTRLQHMGAAPGIIYRFQAEVDRQLDALELQALPTARAFAGASAALDVLKAQGYRMALLTRSSETFAKRALNQAGLLPYLERLRTRNDSGPAKPDPESLLILLKDANIPKDRAVLVGDGAPDLECALGAGVDFVGMVHAGPEAAGREEELRRKGARRLAHSFPELVKLLTGA